MQQPQPTMMPAMPSFPSANITTEQIQKCLDDNKKLILAILDNQNLGKLAECAQYQTQLQKNLMYLAAIADAQPQMPAAMPAQMSPHPGMTQGGLFMQHAQVGAGSGAMTPPQGMFPPRMPVLVSTPHQPHELHPHPHHQQQQQQRQLHPQHHQAVQAQMNIRPGVPNSGMTPNQTEANLGGASGGASQKPGETSDARGSQKQDGSEAGASGGDGQGNKTAGHGGDGQPSQRAGGDAAP